ncbi:Otopetrin family-containing protein [Strongyloides ratti]|uniref:Otopetrin family-containing protein n=1 Tax=Strongyloides ratti TaxID=34506 RepID=A0A090KPN3_STRRB|nr:Otopetrin family-containing protein [Strongyloides ratti]CEF59533.1 Otopetrin family-containing protein [Strongyloides ratti]
MNEEDSSDIMMNAWIYNNKAKNMLITSFSAFYAFIVILFALVLELAQIYDVENDDKKYKEDNYNHTIHNNYSDTTEGQFNNYKNILFGIYMYGGSLAIFIFFYIYLLFKKKPSMKKCLNSVSSEVSIESVITDSGSLTLPFRNVTHDRPSSGSLFERLGMVIFGIIGVVYYAFPLFIYVGDHEYKVLKLVQDILSIIFFFIQMHFLFCNSSLNINSYHCLAKFGYMHLISTNIWTWIRYILIEETHMKHEIKDIILADEELLNMYHNTTSLFPYSQKGNHTCSGASCVMEHFGAIMYTCIVEYSLICAGITFSLWRNMSVCKNKDLTYVSRKKHIRIDCSNTTTGLFSGLAFLTTTLTCTALFYSFQMVHEGQKAIVLFNTTDLLQYSITIFVCCFAAWKMRFFQYNDIKNVSLRNQQYLDSLLLLLGVMGELLYSITGVVGLLGAKEFNSFNILLIITHLVRLCQVATQSCLIYIAMHLKACTEGLINDKKKPGKEIITFLIICNMSMFIMNMLETGHVGASEEIINFYGKYSWIVLVRSFSPLTIFYRFHSAVCFVEIWKNVYSNK